MYPHAGYVFMNVPRYMPWFVVSFISYITIPAAHLAIWLFAQYGLNVIWRSEHSSEATVLPLSGIVSSIVPVCQCICLQYSILCQDLSLNVNLVEQKTHSNSLYTSLFSYYNVSFSKCFLKTVARGRWRMVGRWWLLG